MAKKRKGASPFQPASITLRRKPVAKRGRFPKIRNLGPVVSTAVKKLKASIIGKGPVYTGPDGKQVQVKPLWQSGDPE